MNLFRLSINGLLTVVLFLLLLVSFRFLLPYADEADWEYRISHLSDIGTVHSFFYPDYSSALSYSTRQQCDSLPNDPKWLFGSIDHSCLESVDSIFSRVMLVLYTLSPLFLILIFPYFFYNFLAMLRVRISYVEWSHRLNALRAFILFPGAIFYLSVLSLEHFFLVVALYIFLFFGIAPVQFFLLFLLYLIDIGNFIVVLLFVSFFYFLRFFYFNFGRRNLLLLSFFLLLLAYFFNRELISVVPIPDMLSGKMESMLKVINDGSYNKEYPLFLRPLITFTGFFLLLPSGIKSLLGMFFVGSVFLYWILLKRNAHQNISDVLIFLLAPILFISLFTFIFPTYAYSKYYVFSLPFVFYALIALSNFYSVWLFSLSTSVVVLINLLLFYI